jgi:HAD superfamily hydrolase (TIGR01450 family)
VTLSPLAAGYDHFLIDLDGCLWVGDRAVPGAPAALEALRTAGKNIVFLTNEASYAPDVLVRKLWRLGFKAAVDEMVSAGAAVEEYLLARQRPRRAFVIGAQALVDHVARAGMRVVNRTDLAARADVVIVSDHVGFDYAELRTAAQAVLRGADLIGLQRDATFPMPDGPWPGGGAILAAVEAAAGRLADVVIGKPEPPMYAAALRRLGPGRVLAAGDRLDIDVAGAQRAGLDAAVVLTGATSLREAERADPGPAVVADSIAELLCGSLRRIV